MVPPITFAMTLSSHAALPERQRAQVIAILREDVEHPKAELRVVPSQHCSEVLCTVLVTCGQLAVQDGGDGCPKYRVPIGEVVAVPGIERDGLGFLVHLEPVAVEFHFVDP
jgi:hypothetical protein